MDDVKQRRKRASTPTFEKQLIADQEGSVRLAIQGMVELMEQHMRSCETCRRCPDFAVMVQRMKTGLKLRR